MNYDETRQRIIDKFRDSKQYNRQSWQACKRAVMAELAFETWEKRNKKNVSININA
jgi:hypothetical protein